MNELQKLISEHGLVETKAQVILTNFQNFFELAADWQKKASTITITDISQAAEMKMAREGRLFLKQKRIEVEKKRKELKEDCLREGKAIDGIANVLKALIEPIENYLETQEKFAENKEKERLLKLKIDRTDKMKPFESVYPIEGIDFAIISEESFQQMFNLANNLMQQKIEAEKKAEADRVEKIRKEKEEQEKIRLENERLKKEAAEREVQAKIEREKQEAILKAEREKAEAEKKKIEAAAEEARKKAESERDKIEAEKRKIEAELKAKKEAELAEKTRIEAEKRAEEKRIAKLAKAPDKEKLFNILSKLRSFFEGLEVEIKTEDAKIIQYELWSDFENLIQKNLKKIEML